MVSKKLYIQGRVQGVWFRTSTQKRAEELDLTGFVMNRLDGSVYVEIEGEQEAVDDFIQWCWQGPQMSMVKEVLDEAQELQGFDGFKVRR